VAEQAQVFFLLGVKNLVLHVRVVHTTINKISYDPKNRAVGGVPERAGIRDNAGVKAPPDGRIDLLPVAHAGHKTVGQFTRTTGRGLRKHKIGHRFRVEVVVNQNTRSGNIFDVLPQFVYPTYRVEIQKNKNVFLVQHLLSLFRVDVPNQYFLGLG
jgi:hypothetical protein